MAQDMTKSSRLAAHYHSLPRQLRNKLGNTRAPSRGVVDKATGSPAAHKRMTGKSIRDVFGGNDFLTRATHRLDLHGCVLDNTFWSQVLRITANRLSRILQGRLRWKMCRKFFLSSTTTHTVLSPPVLPSQTCFIVFADFGFWNTHVIRGRGTCPKSQLLRRSLARLGPWRIIVFLDHRAESER